MVGHTTYVLVKENNNDTMKAEFMMRRMRRKAMQRNMIAMR